MNPTIVNGFYSNLLQQYIKFSYSLFHIWNVDENGCNINKNNLGKVLIKKGV